ncbi:MAG: 30S ribosomal protein S20 [Chthoniobacterales bacterium]
MANIASSEKSARQDVVRSAHKSSILAGIKTAQKRFLKAVTDKNADDAKTQYPAYLSTLDKAAKRGAIHQNSADRRKSSATRALRSVTA